MKRPADKILGTANPAAFPTTAIDDIFARGRPPIAQSIVIISAELSHKHPPRNRAHGRKNEPQQTGYAPPKSHPLSNQTARHSAGFAGF